MRVLFGDGSVGRYNGSISKLKSSADSATGSLFSLLRILVLLAFFLVGLIGAEAKFTLLLLLRRSYSKEFFSEVLVRMRVLPAFLLRSVGTVF